ncbi:uncharacterized protein LOC100876843 isoform X1 [Megachile rotundata]|uniref:uncharacterized protein LOC100876843 isoform X1 n=1 Tax=Megachile rotundata TaxID=143995 RepID=UPI003FD62960
MSILNVIIVLLITGCIGQEEQTPEVPSFFRPSGENRGIQVFFEQCRDTNLWKGQLARVNVFAFLDPSWYYSYKQTIMLKLLKERLVKAGFTDILFFAVTPPPDLPENTSGNRIEIRTWKEMSKILWRSEYSAYLDETVFNDKDDKNDIIVLQDTPELNIWENFRALKDEVIIVDGCGKLTYQVIIPWSIYLPYVKAAILATYNEDPCGPCDVQTSQESDLMYYEDDLRNTNLNEKETENEQKRIEDGQNTSTTSFNMNITSDTTVAIDTNYNSTNQSNKYIPTTEEISTMIPDLGTTVSTQTNVDNNNSFSAINNVYIDNSTNSENNLGDKVGEEDHNATSEDTRREEKVQTETETLPLRIILYAPHLHQEADRLKKYTHMVLKTGSPDYHDHFNTKNEMPDQEIVVPQKLNSSMLEHKTLTEYVNNINESPGTYGEIADYWRTQDGAEITDKNEDAEFLDYDDTTADDTESNINDASVSESSIVRLSDAIDTNTNIENNDDTNDLMQQRLMDHYDRLLTWIYYNI